MIEDIKKKMRAIPGMDILLAQDWVLPWVGELGWETVKRVMVALGNDIAAEVYKKLDDTAPPFDPLRRYN